MPIKHSQRWQNMQWRKITPSIGRMQKWWTIVKGTAKDAPLKPGTSMHSEQHQMKWWRTSSSCVRTTHLSTYQIHTHTNTDFLDIPFHDSIQVHDMHKNTYPFYLITYKWHCIRCQVSQSLQGGYVSIHCCCEKACLYLCATVTIYEEDKHILYTSTQ